MKIALCRSETNVNRPLSTPSRSSGDISQRSVTSPDKIYTMGAKLLWNILT